MIYFIRYNNKTNRKQCKCQIIRAQFGTKRTSQIWLQVTQPALTERQPEDIDKHPDTNDACLNLFLSTIQKHLNTFPAMELVQSVPSHTHHSPNQPAKQTQSKFQKLWQETVRNTNLSVIYPGKALAF